MEQLPYVTGRAALADAQALIATFGASAAIEAALRAGRSREVGNHIHFCHWRQIERLVDVLSASEAIGTVH